MHGYLWEPAWCWPYESAWSLVEKFKYANAVTNNAFKELFNLRYAVQNWSIIVHELYIYRSSRFDVDKFFRFFQIKDDHFSYLSVIENNEFAQVFRKEIHYCPSCMKLGYHSYLHQLTFAVSCPFHGEQLICLLYNGKAVPYSLNYISTEAYSVMRARERQPAERYVDVLPSKYLIDGIWQVTPDYIKIDTRQFDKIIFFSPSTESSRPARPAKPVKHSTLRLVDSLYTEKRDYIPVFSVDSKSCDSKYNELLTRCETWFRIRYHAFHRNWLKFWFIAILIEELIQDIDKDVLRHSIYNMQHRQFYYAINDEEYIIAASAIITAFITTNARDLYRGIDNSTIYYYGAYERVEVKRCSFSISDIDCRINSKGNVNSYIPFLIYKRFFDVLHEQILSKLQVDSKLSFDYNYAFDFDIPDCVITQKGDYIHYFEIY